MFRQVGVAAVMVVLLAPAAWAQPAPRRDGQIFKEISHEVVTWPQFTVFDDVQVAVHQGIVTVYGRVTMPYKRDEIARRLERVPGVTQVINKIGVLPASRFDSELRLKIARAIYGNPSFWRYGSMANPPIHIVVENGRVTLTGVVHDNVERMLARSLANGFNALAVVDQLRTEAEARADQERIKGE